MKKYKDECELCGSAEKIVFAYCKHLVKLGVIACENCINQKYFINICNRIKKEEDFI